MYSLALVLGLILLLQGYSSAHPQAHDLPRKSKVLVSREFDADNLYANWPSYRQLPLDPSYPTKAAWGVWVSPKVLPNLQLIMTHFGKGADDVQGALNHITNETIRAAAGEIQIGKAINLKSVRAST